MLFWYFWFLWMWLCDCKCFFFGIVICWLMDLIFEIVDELELFVWWIIIFICWWFWVLFKIFLVLVFFIILLYVVIGIIFLCGCNCFIWDDFFVIVWGGLCFLILFVLLLEIWLDLFLFFVFEWCVWLFGREGILLLLELLL